MKGMRRRNTFSLTAIESRSITDLTERTPSMKHVVIHDAFRGIFTSVGKPGKIETVDILLRSKRLTSDLHVSSKNSTPPLPLSYYKDIFSNYIPNLYINPI